MHTVTSHKNDKSKYLSYHQRNAIHTAVSAHPQAKPTEVRRNLKNFSPSKHVSASRLKSVGYAVRQERDTLAVNELYGISVDDTVQSVQLFCQSAWLGDLIARHNDADDLFHLDLFAPVCIAYKLDQGNDMFFVALSNPYMLLELSRQVNCGWALQLQVDTTFKICDRDLNKLTLGLNSLGAHYHPLSVNIIPGNAESAVMYRNAWNSVRKAAHAILSDLKSCPMAGCELCTTIEKIKSEKRMKAFLKSKIGKELQWNVQNVMGDEHKGIIKWTGDIGVEHGLCFVHKSGEILSKY